MQCTHSSVLIRRQLLALRALNERFLLIRALPFPCTKTMVNVYIEDLIVLSVMLRSDVHVASSSIEVQRADALYDFLQMPTNAAKSVRMVTLYQIRISILRGDSVSVVIS